MAQRRQFVAELTRAAADELALGHGVAAGSQLGQLLKVLEDGWFFPLGGRPERGRRTRSLGRPCD
ncbi:MAG TPA: hypothetical protein VH592_12495 [Gemmataceae bacterium]